jgi:hypothetical protein
MKNTQQTVQSKSIKKKPVTSPRLSLSKAVQLSLQSGRNTQLRTCTILVIFSCFWNTTDAIVSNIKKHKTLTINIYDIISFEEVSFLSTSNKFFHNFHLSESSFTYSGLPAEWVSVKTVNSFLILFYFLQTLPVH